MFRPGRRLLIALAVLATCAVIAVSAVFKIARPGAPSATEITRPETPAGSHEAAGEASVEPVAAEAPPEDPADDVLDSVLADIDIDLVEYTEEQRRERLEKATKELGEKLASKWEMREVPGASEPVRVRKQVLSEGERARLLEEFLAEFGLSVHTYWQGFMLARHYTYTDRFDDARRLYNEIVAALPASFFSTKQEMRHQLAEMEIQAGNLQAAEGVLRGIIDEAVPPEYMNVESRMRDNRADINKNLKAPLLLAKVYRRAGRAQDAESVLKQVAGFALGLPKEHHAFENMASYTGQACRGRIDLIFDEAGADQIDEAMRAAERLIEDYRRNLQGRDWRSREHIKRYIEQYVDHLHQIADERAERIRQAHSGDEP